MFLAILITAKVVSKQFIGLDFNDVSVCLVSHRESHLHGGGEWLGPLHLIDLLNTSFSYSFLFQHF